MIASSKLTPKVAESVEGECGGPIRWVKHNIIIWFPVDVPLNQSIDFSMVQKAWSFLTQVKSANDVIVTWIPDVGYQVPANNRT